MSLTSKARNERITSSRLIIILSALLFISVILAFMSFIHTANWFEYNDRYATEVSKQLTLAQRLVKYSLIIQQGNKTAFKGLKEAQAEFSTSIRILENGIESEGLPPSPEEVAKELMQAKQGYASLQELIKQILSKETELTEFNQIVTENIQKIPKIVDYINNTIPDLISRKATIDQLQIIYSQIIWTQQLKNELRQIYIVEDKENQSKIALEKLFTNFKELNTKIERVTSVDNKRKLELLNEKIEPLAVNLNELIALTSKVMPALNSIKTVSEASENADAELRKLLEAYRNVPGRLKIFGMTVSQYTAIIFGSLATLFLMLLGNRILKDARRRENESKALNETNQKAILRLLDEMGDLADGDLTVAATVTEDITGAIADSINYAIEALRNLVTTINQTSEKIFGASKESLNTTGHLTEAAELQAQQISQATTAIKDMNIAIQGMTRNAKESAEVARKAVDIANKGAGTVGNTIQGMNTIREQIQETSKRIKRLGESSQEIGDIVELIDDIADQTNILALNAAMQAAMAGEAGRGFAVVADEVQRLAERSSNATKQIEALVKTIQADTNEAVASMEVSTAGVVRGARLAEDAGKALGEIEEVSNYIAGLTREIADSALHESQEASKVNEVMSIIQEIASQAAAGARETAASVGTLAELAEELRQSVAGFRLP
jgi:twitching motility protein PilJ